MYIFFGYGELCLGRKVFMVEKVFIFIKGRITSQYILDVMNYWLVNVFSLVEYILYEYILVDA